MYICVPSTCIETALLREILEYLKVVSPLTVGWPKADRCNKNITGVWRREVCGLKFPLRH